MNGLPDHDTDSNSGGQFGAVVLALADNGTTTAHDKAFTSPEDYRCVTGPNGLG
jgi:hypothetical protein